MLVPTEISVVYRMVKVSLSWIRNNRNLIYIAHLGSILSLEVLYRIQLQIVGPNHRHFLHPESLSVNKYVRENNGVNVTLISVNN